MTYILHIDTSDENGTVALSADGVLLGEEQSPAPMQHAAFLQPAVQQLMAAAGLPLAALSALSVSNGPGSYTGLRVGLASAKGICFALDLPLITLSTLDILAASIRDTSFAQQPGAWICPMIDARRMEVFTALYDDALQVYQPPHALVLQPESFGDSLHNQPIIFGGNGAAKWQVLCQHPHAGFAGNPDRTEAHIRMAFASFVVKKFTNTVSAEPFYLKAFHSTQKTG